MAGTEFLLLVTGHSASSKKSLNILGIQYWLLCFLLGIITVISYIFYFLHLYVCLFPAFQRRFIREKAKAVPRGKQTGAKACFCHLHTLFHNMPAVFKTRKTLLTIKSAKTSSKKTKCHTAQHRWKDQSTAWNIKNPHTNSITITQLYYLCFISQACLWNW